MYKTKLKYRERECARKKKLQSRAENKLAWKTFLFCIIVNVLFIFSSLYFSVLLSLFRALASILFPLYWFCLFQHSAFWRCVRLPSFNNFSSLPPNAICQQREFLENGAQRRPRLYFSHFFPSHNRKMIFIFVSIANFFENYFIIYFILAFYSGNGKNSSFVCVTVCFSFTFLIHFRAGNGWAYAFNTRLFEYLSVSVNLQCVFFLFIYGNRNRLEALFLFWANATGNSNPNIIKHCKHFFVQRIGTAKLITLLDKRHGNEKFAIRWRKTWEREKIESFQYLTKHAMWHIQFSRETNSGELHGKYDIRRDCIL